MIKNSIFTNLKAEVLSANSDYDKSQAYLKLLFIIFQNSQMKDAHSAEIDQEVYMILHSLFARKPRMSDVMSPDDLLLSFAPFHKRILASGGDKKNEEIKC